MPIRLSRTFRPARRGVSLRVTLSLLLTASLLVGCTASPPPVQHTSTPTAFAAMDTYVSEALDRTNVPGAALAVVSPDGIEHQQTWGRDGDGDPVTTGTPFLWGSVAKPVTAEVTLALVEQGRLDLDAPVRRYLPEFRLADPAQADRITLRHLLNHTSGLPASMQGLTDIADPERRPADVLPALADVESVAEPGAEFGYTSVDYAVLAAVIEEVAGAAYGEVAREVLLDPIGSEHLITSSAEAASTLPRGHRHLFGQPIAFRTGYDPAGVSYGYLGGSLTDLARFAQLNLSGGTVAGHRVLEESSIQQAWAPTADMSDDGTEGYGLGWRSKHLSDGSEIVWHSGAAPGYFAHLILLPEQQRAVVVLQNAHGELQAADEYVAGFGVADLLAQNAPEPISTGWTHPVVISLLSVASLAVLGTLVSTSVGLVRRTTTHRRHRALRCSGWIAFGLACAGSGVAFTRWAGIPLHQLALWNPDLALLVYLLVGGGILLAGLRLWRLARAPRRPSS